MPTGYAVELIGDDRVWTSLQYEASITGWPLEYERANLAIFNATTDKLITINTFNTRPYTGPCGLFPLVTVNRITACSDGENVEVVSMDTNNAAFPSQVVLKYRPTAVTITANTVHRTVWVDTGMNLDRAMQRYGSRISGFGMTMCDQTEVSFNRDSGVQNYVCREGEGIALVFAQDSGPNVFKASFYVKNSATGATYYCYKMIEPLFMNGAPFLAFYNGAGSGAVFEVSRIQIQEIGDDQIPIMDFMMIDTCCDLCENSQVTWADTNDAIPTGILVKRNVTVKRAGSRFGAILTAPRFRNILGGESPYGPNSAGGAAIARRGLYCHDVRYKDTNTPLTLRPGYGIAVISRNPSSRMYTEAVCNFSVSTISTGGSGTFPSANDVRLSVTYGPTGADYTGTITFPSQSAVYTGIAYGAGGVEYTGTLNPTFPSTTSVRTGVSYGLYGASFTGTIDLPSATSVENGISYGAGGTEVTGSLVLPSQTSVYFAITFGGGGAEYTGTLNPVFPSTTAVRTGISYGLYGASFTGVLVAGGGGGGNRIFYPSGISGRG